MKQMIPLTFHTRQGVSTDFLEKQIIIIITTETKEVSVLKVNLSAVDYLYSERKTSHREKSATGPLLG